MVPVWVMVVVAVVVVALPFLLARIFNGQDRSDSRGRRISRRWRPADVAVPTPAPAPDRDQPGAGVAAEPVTEDALQPDVAGPPHEGAVPAHVDGSTERIGSGATRLTRTEGETEP